jgi:uracil-DNA glycosylase
VARRKRSYRSLASLQRDNGVCRACAEAGYPLESLPVFEGRAGQTLRRWLDMDEERFYSTFYCSSVTRCYPGRHPSGRGDRPPSPRELELCRFWLEWELSLLRPRLVVPVGGLAIKRVLGISGLAGCIGSTFALGDAIAVPLPHPSGASGWLNSLENRKLLDEALALLRAAL